MELAWCSWTVLELVGGVFEMDVAVTAWDVCAFCCHVGSQLGWCGRETKQISTSQNNFK